jgi:UDP-N-acetylmuramoylalanine--D-glutamate ligase
MRAGGALDTQGEMTSTKTGALFDQWLASGREIAVVGLGKSGVSATLLLRRLGIPVYASDTGRGQAYEAWARELQAVGAQVEVGGHDLGRIAKAAAVVVAPGVPPNVPALEAARRAGIQIYAEVDIGFLALQGTRCVGITGTNGKTTTTSLIAHVLTAAGVRTETAGNIGRPLCEVARSGNRPDWLALELSSFQLHDAPHLKPAIGVLTNLAPNHLDRYAALEEYYADKALLFRNAAPESVWVTNADDPAVREMTRSVRGKHLRFSVQERAEAWYDRDGGYLVLGRRQILPRAELPLLGDHNVANALAAILVAAEIGAPAERIAAGLRTFRAIPHRVEPVREVDGVLWINDSKSTNITSTEVAIVALDRPFVLLLGGRHKGEPYTRLRERLEGRCRAVVAYGEAGSQIVQDLGGSLEVVPARSFEEVLTTARALARPGDAVLLSPACSSYDMFRNYEERGDRFRAAVEAL